VFPDTAFISLGAYDFQQIRIGTTALTLVLGDITQQDTDAIVNAANSSLLGGGGVDGAIHRAGGPRILEECKAIRARQGGCPVGEAVITTGGQLRAKKIIHAVGPIWRGGTAGEDRLLSNAYRNSLHLAVTHRLRTVAFPSISTGAYGFPSVQASRIAFDTVVDFVKGHPQMEEIRFVAFSQYDFDVYSSIFRKTQV
jgi:O-acetyl-ADP-ribose deacetylase (regulator of RNase III)